MDLDFLTAPTIDLALGGTTRDAALRALVDRLGAAQPDLALDRDGLTRALLDREALGSTGVGMGVAVPHCKWKGVERIVGALGRSGAGVEFGARDGKPVRLFFLVVSPVNASGPHIRVLAAVSRLVRDAGLRDAIFSAPTPDAVLAAIRAAGG